MESKQEKSAVHEELVRIFRTEIRGKKLPPLSHDGAIGHWIESKFGIRANADDEADWRGLELKSGKTKTTFGDWSADRYLWQVEGSGISSREDFLRIFGTQSRPDRPRRFSWAGSVFPTVAGFNAFGQRMYVNDDLDVVIEYDFAHDLRTDKFTIVPKPLHHQNLELARWNRASLESRVDRKFGQRGWVKFQSQRGVIDHMLIGPPMTYSQWINGVQDGDIFLDSGMYFDPVKPNNRPYSNWRALNTYWDSLAIERID